MILVEKKSRHKNRTNEPNSQVCYLLAGGLRASSSSALSPVSWTVKWKEDLTYSSRKRKEDLLPGALGEATCNCHAWARPTGRCLTSGSTETLTRTSVFMNFMSCWCYHYYSKEQWDLAAWLVCSSEFTRFQNIVVWLVQELIGASTHSPVQNTRESTKTVTFFVWEICSF